MNPPGKVQQWNKVRKSRAKEPQANKAGNSNNFSLAWRNTIAWFLNIPLLLEEKMVLAFIHLNTSFVYH